MSPTLQQLKTCMIICLLPNLIKVTCMNGWLIPEHHHTFFFFFFFFFRIMVYCPQLSYKTYMQNLHDGPYYGPCYILL